MIISRSRSLLACAALAGLILSACGGGDPGGRGGGGGGGAPNDPISGGNPFPQPGTEADPPTARLEQRVDTIAEAALRDGPVAGLSIAIFRNSREILASGYGFSDLDRRQPATAETRYDIASVSKLFTALAILKLVDEGVLGLDDHVATRLPAFPNPDQGAISLRQLLNHTSGLNDYEAADFVRMLHAEAPPEPLTPAFVLDYLAGRPLDAPPGAEWQYTNSGFYLAGLIIEQATGTPWGEYVRQAIALPLGLSDTLPCDELRPDQRSAGYESTDAGFERSAVYAEAGVQGDGGLCSTARDLARLPAALAEHSLLPEKLLAEMLRPTVLADGVTVDYGLGVRLGRIDGHPLWGHTGSVLLTYASVVAHYPEDGVTIVVLVNTSNTQADALVVEGGIAREVLGMTTSLAAATFEYPAFETASLYDGEYVGDRRFDIQAILGGSVPPGRERFRILRKDGVFQRLVLTPGAEGPPLELVYTGNHSFGRADWPMDRFVFDIEAGRARGYSEYYNGMFVTSPEFRQRVAIKVVHAGLPSAGVVRRFSQERSILASFGACSSSRSNALRPIRPTTPGWE